MYMAIFGLFSMVWFGWAQEKPPANWRIFLGLASGVALLMCSVGAYFSVIHWNDGSVLSHPETHKQYLMFVGIEFLLAGIGAYFFIKRNKNNYVAPWVALVVGIHFFWLKDLFQDPSLIILGVLLIGIAGISLWLSHRWNIASSFLTGIGSGAVLFCFAILGFIRYLGNI